MSALAGVEFANGAFYDAFSTANIEQMSELWAPIDAVFCCHPGWQPIHGRAAVLRSWAEIFANAGAMPISHRVLVRDLIGDMAIVCCLESLSGHGFIATNLFVRDGKVWRMVHHHAGPIAGPVPIIAGSTGGVPN